MKRALQVTLVFFIIVAALLTALPFVLSTETMRERIIANMSKITSGEITFQANPRISFNPFLGIELSDFKVQDPFSGDEQTNLLVAEKVKAKLDILPALLGQISISEYHLIRPKLNLKIYTDGKSNWYPHESRLGKIIQTYERQQQKDESDLSDIETIDFGSFHIVDGIIEYEDAIAGSNNRITGIDGSFAWPSTSDAMHYSGVAIWQGEMLEVELDIDSPVTMITGGETETSLILASNPVNLNFDGRANMISNLFVAGSLDWESPSLNRISEFLQLDLGSFSSIGSIKATGKIEATADSMKLTEANMEINENLAEGVIIITRSELGDISLDGTLAFEEINADNYFEIFIAQDTETLPEETAINFSSDLRISAQTFTSGPLHLEQIAATISTRNHEWSFDISDSVVFDGRVIAQLGKRIVDSKYQNFIDITANDINTSDIAAFFPDNKVSVSGKSNFKANLTTNYRIEADFIQRLNGVVDMQIENGSIVGIDIPQLMQASRSDTNTQYEINDGDTTQFANLTSKIALHNGLAYINNTNIQNDTPDITLTGNINLSNNAWVLRASSNAEKTNPVIMGGTIRAPLILYTQKGPADTLPEAQPENHDNSISN